MFHLTSKMMGDKCKPKAKSDKPKGEKNDEVEKPQSTEVESTGIFDGKPEL